MTDRIEHWGRRVYVLAAMAAMALAGCKGDGTKAPAVDQASTSKPSGYTQKTAVPSELVLPKGFTCCNFHHDGDWISDSVDVTLPMIPVGTPAKVTRIGRNRAYTVIGGQQMRLGHDYGRDQETLQQWIVKMVVTDDPIIKIATFPDAIKDAIRMGRLTKGMTREQVIMSVGYPLTNENASLDAPVWRMRASDTQVYQVVWGTDGLVKDILGDPWALSLIVYKP